MNSPLIAFIGAGNMASAMIGGLCAQGVPAERLRASNRGAQKRERLAAQHGIHTYAANADAVAGADIVVLAVKPQMMKEVCLGLAPHLAPGQLIVSVAAGITSASLQKWLGAATPVVRCMPNTPSALRQGVSGLFATPQVSADQRTQAQAIAAAVGLALWVDDEAQIDAVTAVSGSGPAYFFLLIEAMSAAAEKLGLPRESALQMTVQTALGAARMACESGVDAATLRRQVTSPNGTTEAAIKTFQAGGFEALVERAMAAAAGRAAEMAAQLGE